MKTFSIAATWGFAFTALAFGQSVGAAAAVAALGTEVARLNHDGAAAAIFLLVGNPVQVVTLALAARMTEENLFAYLALDVPRWREMRIAVAGLVVLILATDGLTAALGRNLVPAFELDIQRTAAAEGALLPLWIAIIVVVPAGEEILFRGFLFRGFQPHNALQGIVAISLAWALFHGEYDWFAISEVFVLGIYLGLIRLWSGSTTLTILLHMLVNAVSVAEAAVALGWV